MFLESSCQEPLLIIRVPEVGTFAALIELLFKALDGSLETADSNEFEGPFVDEIHHLDGCQVCEFDRLIVDEVQCLVGYRVCDEENERDNCVDD